MLFSMVAAELFDSPDGKRISDRLDCFGGRSWGRGGCASCAAAARFIAGDSPFNRSHFLHHCSSSATNYLMLEPAMPTEMLSVIEVVPATFRAGEGVRR
jgi:hypothetical protein